MVTRATRRLRLVLFLATLSSSILSSWSQSKDTDNSSAQAKEEQDIYTAVIRYQMENWIRSSEKNESEAKSDGDKAIARRLNFKVFFVSIDGHDPSDELMSRLSDLPRTIKKASFEKPAKGPHGPTDKVTGKTGIVFSAHTIRWSGKDSAELEGGYYCGGLCAAEYTFKVKREDGKWVVQSSRMSWIS
jgi:hypothetical protein